MIVSFVLTNIIFLFYSVYMCFALDEFVPIFPIFVPYIDEKTSLGFAILCIYHITCLIVAVMGFSGQEFFTTIIIISSLIFSKLISLDLKQINMDLQEDGAEMLQVKGRLRNVFLMHQNVDEYVTL